MRLALGGLLVGAIALIYPEVWGNGYVVTNDILKGSRSEVIGGVDFHESRWS